jgi:hypothetical protein
VEGAPFGQQPSAGLEAYLTEGRKAATLGDRLTTLSCVRNYQDSLRADAARLADGPEHSAANTALPPTARPLCGSRPDARHWGARRPNRWPTDLRSPRDGQHLVSLRPHLFFRKRGIFFWSATKPVNFLVASPLQETQYGAARSFASLRPPSWRRRERGRRPRPGPDRGAVGVGGPAQGRNDRRRGSLTL